MKNDNRVKILSYIAVALVILLLGMGGYLVYHIASTPLAERMVLTPQSNPAAGQPPDSAAQAAQPTATAQDAGKKEATCGETGTQVILFVGEDYNNGNPPLGADTVRVIKVDYDNQKIDVVTFPRDLLVQVKGLDNRTEAALGLAYFYKKEAVPGNDEKHRVTQATQLVGQALLDEFGLPSDYYFTFQLNNIPAVIDKIGGVEINNPEAFTTERNVTFPAGKQTLNGALAAEYSRAIQPGGDLARSRRQNLFMQALQDKMISANILPTVPDLVQEFTKMTVTDLSPKQMANLACLATSVPKDSITFNQVEGDLVTAGEDGVLVPNVEQIKARLKEWLDL